ncbi:MAG: alginate lyase family protein [Anaerolineae bacterium]|nr:alginate lyase family protein [Anaerolineae bacterium]
MRRVNVRYPIWRIQAVLAKGPEHLLRLGQWYAGQAAQQAFRSWRPSAVGERAFLAQLSMPSARQARRDGDPVALKRAVAHHFRKRARPVFFFDPNDIQALVVNVQEADKKRTIAQADEICDLVFRFRGEPPVAFDGPVDWFYCPRGNRDWTWELNRHSYFVTLGRAYAYTGDDRYVHTFRDLLLDWLKRNPVGLDQPNWASVLEVAYRINAWIWAYHHFRVAPGLDDDALLACLRGLWIHGRYLAANLEYHVPNNHLLLESKALAMCGLLFPEFRDAGEWLERGLSILWQQLRRQVGPDGVHREQATMYHRMITSELLELLVLLDNNGIVVPPGMKDIFKRLLDFERAFTGPDGQIPLIGDSSLSDSYIRFSALSGGAVFLGCAGGAPAAIDEATLWLLGLERVARPSPSGEVLAPPASQAFPEGGYFIMRDGDGREAPYLIFDCGPFSYRPAPGHGHADALSFELHACGRPLIVDPGVYTYHLGRQWRNYFRSTPAHNTAVVDGEDQSLLLGTWHILRPARVTLHEWVTTRQFDFVDGSHDGYTRLRQPIIHRRQIFFAKPEYWVIFDLLNGQGQHRFDLYFHLMPDARVSLDPLSGAARIEYSNGVGLLVCPAIYAGSQAEVIAGSLDPIQGWVSRYSGEKTPAPTLRYGKVIDAPTMFVTVLYPSARMDRAAVRVSPLVVTDGERAFDEVTVTGLRVEVGPYVDYLVVDRREQPGRKAFGRYITDGRLVYLRRCTSGSGPIKAVIHRGSELRLSSEPWIVRAEGPVSREPTKYNGWS